MPGASTFLVAMLLVVTGLPTTGCGLVLQGIKQPIPVTSTPPGARVELAGFTETTPATIAVRRGVKFYVLRAELPGYAPKCQLVDGHLNVGLLVIGAVPYGVPLAIDWIFKTLDVYPERLHVTLVPLRPDEVARPLPDDQDVIASWRASDRNLCLEYSERGL